MLKINMEAISYRFMEGRVPGGTNGLENRPNRKVKGSTPLPSANPIDLTMNPLDPCSVVSIVACHAYETQAYEGHLASGLPFRIRCWRGQVYIGYGFSIPVTHMITPDCIKFFYDLGPDYFLTEELARDLVELGWVEWDEP